MAEATADTIRARLKVEISLMRPSFAPLALLASLALGLAACGPTGGGSQPAASQPAASAGSAMPCQSTTPSGATPAPGCLPPPSVGATPILTVGPGGTPIGTWTLTLVGGPAAGDYGGTDEMICSGIANGPMSVSFQPVGSAPIQQVDASTIGSDSSILVSAGGLESGAAYQATTGQLFQTVVLVEAGIDAGILTLKIKGTQQFPGEGVLREMKLTATCPLFPNDSGG
jgi:hypothetical protein